MQRGENLRHDQGGTRPLNNTRGRQLFNVPRHSAQQRGQAKDCHTPHKQATAAKIISQLAAKCEADGKRHAIKRDNQLQLGGGSVQ